jgi:predicted MFS family arabinose efflux permease
MNERHFRLITLAILVGSMALLSASIGALSYLSLSHYEKRLMPEIQSKALTVGAELARRFGQAVEFSAIEGVRGSREFFDRTLEQNTEIAYLALESAAGAILMERRAAGVTTTYAKATAPEPDHSVVNFDIAIANGEVTLGTLHLGVSSSYSRRILLELVYDVLTILVVSLLITFGLLSFMIQTSVAGRLHSVLGILDRIRQGDFRPRSRPSGSDRIGRLLNHLEGEMASLRLLYRDTMANLEAMGQMASEERRVLLRIGQRNRLDDPPVDDTSTATRLAAMRLVVFIFFIAEEMTRPFMPLFIKDVAGNSGDAALIVSVPLTLFMLTAAFAQPCGGMLMQRLGRRRLFLAAALLSVAGMALSAVVVSYWQLLLFRGLSAAGYGVVFVSCQSYAIDNTTAKTRAGGIAMFVGGIMAAALCGPSIGGLVADHFGFRMALLVAAAIALGGAAIGQAVMADSNQPAAPQKPFTLRDVGVIVSNRRLLALIVLVAIPAKLVLSAVLFYLTPIYLAAMGEPQSVVGRVLMIYGLATVLLGPFVARFADTYWHQRHWFVGLGAILSGCGFLPILWMPDNFWVLVAGVAALGIGQALSMSPQLALVPELAARECHEMGASVVLGIFRLIERTGGSLGPLAAGALAGSLGNGSAIAWIGQVVLMTGLGFLFSVLFLTPRPASEAKG